MCTIYVYRAKLMLHQIILFTGVGGGMRKQCAWCAWCGYICASVGVWAWGGGVRACM